MRQVLFTIPVFGGVPVFGYGAMLFLAFIVSTQLAAWRAKREKIDPELLYDLALWMFIGGLVGARLFYVVEYWGDKIHSVADIFRIWQGGIVFYGSIMGGTAAFFLYRFLRPFPLLPLLDIVAPSLAVGVAFGRFGCFLNGCCFGDLCDLPVGVSFPINSPPWNAQAHAGLIDSHAGWSLPIHPTQIYSSLDGIILLILLSTFFPLRRRDGEVMALLMVTYPISRFLIEHLRNDEVAIFAGMTVSQNISILLFLLGALFWTYLSTRPRERHADTAPALASA